MSSVEKWKGKRDTAEYFTPVAAEYAAFRPTYPREAFDAMLEGLRHPVHAADVGCGTGISTRLLAEGGAHVIGIDPNQAMLEQAGQAVHPVERTVDYRIGSAERTGLPDRSVDLLLCAQSFHWFDEWAALREFHRILRPRGRLALLWNVRDTGDAFSASYEENSRRAEDAAERDGRVVRRQLQADPTIGGYFGGVVNRSFANPQQLSLGALIGRARSASYFPRLDPLRTELEQSLRDLFNKHAVMGMVSLMQRSELTLATRL